MLMVCERHGIACLTSCLLSCNERKATRIIGRKSCFGVSLVVVTVSGGVQHDKPRGTPSKCNPKPLFPHTVTLITLSLRKASV